MTKGDVGKTIVTAFSALLLFGAHEVEANDFDQFHMSVSNPVYSGDARNVTMVRPIVFFQTLPDTIKTIQGGTKVDVDLGGDVKGAALQFSYAFNEKFSLVAVKDGYVDCEPDHNLSDHSGYADIALGLQYSFVYKPEDNFIVSARLVYETTTGDDEVYQSNGDGNIAPAILFLKGWDKWQFSGSVGLVLPFDDEEENTMLYDAWHLSYAVTDWFRPLAEVNHFRVLSTGERDLNDYASTGDQEDLVAAIAAFNPCDIINLGGEYTDEHKDLITMAVGARFRLTSWLDLGAVYEFPLTSDKTTLLEERFLVDAMLTFDF